MRTLWISAMLFAALSFGGCRAHNPDPVQTLAERANDQYQNRVHWCYEIGATHYRSGMCYRHRPDGTLEWLNLAVGEWNACDPKGKTPEWCTDIIAGGWDPKD